MPREVVIYTDGACEGNPGPGGWAAILLSGPHRKEISGGDPATTNNRMELRASIEALAVLKESCRVELHTDSQYLRDGITRWLPGWKRNGWRTRARQGVKNVDLWRELDRHAERHVMSWSWLKGHAGHEHNEHCDQLAVAEVRRIRAALSPGQLRELLAAFRQEQSNATAALL
jgi:ribonuclease HI